MGIVSFYYGYDNKPLLINNTEISEERPYFSIISRGLKTLPEWTPSKWENIAPQLDLILTGIVITEEQSILETCYGLDVITVLDTAKAIKIFLNENGLKLVNSLIEKDSITDISFKSCFLKEGHTSSVWKTSALIKETQDIVSFALNVSRDKIANEALWSSSIIMEQIQNKESHFPLAKILQKEKILLPEINYEVVVVANQWIENSKELHLVNDISTNSQYFFAIDKFIMDKNGTGQITKLQGKSFSTSETNKIWKQIKAIEQKTSFYDHKINKLIVPKLDINNGDLVWNGQEIIAISFSE